jgi:hypothetical protein
VNYGEDFQREREKGPYQRQKKQLRETVNNFLEFRPSFVQWLRETYGEVPGMEIETTTLKLNWSFGSDRTMEAVDLPSVLITCDLRTLWVLPGFRGNVRIAVTASKEEPLAHGLARDPLQRCREVVMSATKDFDYAEFHEMLKKELITFY